MKTVSNVHGNVNENNLIVETISINRASNFIRQNKITKNAIVDISKSSYRLAKNRLCRI